MRLTILIATALFYNAGFSQVKDLKITKADKLYKEYAYSEFIKVYEGVADKGYKSIDLFKKLGDAYFFNSDYVKANKWYEELYELEGDKETVYYYRYAQTLKSVGENEKSAAYLEKFYQLKKINRDLKKNTDTYDAAIEDYSSRYVVEDSEVNSEFADYGVTPYNDRIVFASTRKPEKGNSKKDYWTSDYYTSLFSASLSKDGSLSNIRSFANEIRGNYHLFSPVFTKDGKTMYFSRNNDQMGKSNIVSGIVLKIFKANLVNGQWKNVTALPFNNDAYNCIHPALSKDEKTLYFVSDMPGGYGDTDIYQVVINDSLDSYGVPRNLGPIVNTAGKETFPHIGEDGLLYFASNGHVGLGGLDLFVRNVKKNDSIPYLVRNLGKPMNSSYDDFNFVKIEGSDFGFFASNRQGGKGKDDIYRFRENILQESEKGDLAFTSLVTKDVDGLAIKDFVVDVGYDLAKNLNLKNILVGLGQYKITNDLEIELQKIVELMRIYPHLNIDIKAHTDSSGPAAYNLKLSNQRAKAAMDYLVSNGVAKERIAAKGYGESFLLNHCSDNVKCTAEEHKINRRIEFIVVKK